MPALPSTVATKEAASGMFRSLRVRNFRIWASGAIVSNVGTWMQRVAQDWLVLTQLTHNNASAVGVVMALQFGPQLVLLPWTGYAADHFDRRKLLFATQGTLGLLALGLGLLTVTGRVQLWQVYVFALLLGCTAAFDAPARQTFVSELVGESDLSNAVALNSTSFNAARMIGPAMAGLLIAAVGCGWVFIVNAASFAAVLGSLCLLRTGEMHPNHRATQGTSHYADGFRYVWQRPDLRSIVLMLALVGTFGLNFPIFISSMAVKAFHAGASRYGLLTSAMAIGSVTGALLSARRAKPYFALLAGAAGVFGAGLCVAALVPDYGLFGVALAVIGVAAQTFTTSTNSYMQLTSEPQMRGRVVAVFLAVAMGGTPIGAPLVGWAADTLGPRWAMGAAGAICTLAAAVGLRHLARHGRWRIRVDARRLRITVVTDPVSEA